MKEKLKNTFCGMRQQRCLFAIAIVVWGSTCRNAIADDTQYWNEFIFEIGLNDRLDVEVATE